MALGAIGFGFGFGFGFGGATVALCAGANDDFDLPPTRPVQHA